MNNLLIQSERVLDLPENFKPDLIKFSDPDMVQKKAFSYLGPYAYIYPSSRKNKKYMILAPARLDSKGEYQKQEWVHFGEMGMSDYTKHLDLDRLDNFRRRNSRWGKSEIYSPGWLSYYLLW